MRLSVCAFVRVCVCACVRVYLCACVRPWVYACVRVCMNCLRIFIAAYVVELFSEVLLDETGVLESSI